MNALEKFAVLQEKLGSGPSTLPGKAPMKLTQFQTDLRQARRVGDRAATKRLVASRSTDYNKYGKRTKKLRLKPKLQSNASAYFGSVADSDASTAVGRLRQPASEKPSFRSFRVRK